MLDSERTFKIEVRLPMTVFETLFMSVIKEFGIETRLSNIFKTTNVKTYHILVSQALTF